MVSARHLIGTAIVVSVAVAVGCASKPHAAAKAHPRSSSSSAQADAGKPLAPGTAPGVGAPASEPAGPESTGDVASVAPHSLADHSERYAKNLESLLTKHPHRPQAAVPAAGDEDATEHVTDTDSYSTIPSSIELPEVDADAQANTGMQVAAQPRPAGPAVEVKREPAQDGALESLPPTGAAPYPALVAQRSSEPSSEPQAAAARSIAKLPAVPTSELVQKLSAKIKEDPRDTVGHLNYQLLQFLMDEQVPELSTIAPLPAEDRELLTTLLDGLSNFRNGLRAEGNSLQSKKVAPLLELADRLRSQGELTISTAALCKSVKRFGVYEPMEPARFNTGKNDNDAILYCEVANFSSQLNDKRLWETKLKQEAVLYSESGLAVWSDKSNTVVDQSRNRLHDFFIADKIRLPATLPVGRYLMKMTVTDLHASRVAEATVPIQVVAQ